MKTYRQREKQGSKVQESTKGPDETKIKVNPPSVQSSSGLRRWLCIQRVPVDPSLNTCFVVWFALCFQALLDRTGYTLDVTTGQRKYGGPPPPQVFTGCQPGVGTEVNDRGGALCHVWSLATGKRSRLAGTRMRIANRYDRHCSCSFRCLWARSQETCMRMSWCPSSRRPGPSGTSG